MGDGAKATVNTVKVEGTVLDGSTDAVKYLATADGFAIVVTGNPPDKTKYGNPCFHLGGQGKDAPMFKTPIGNLKMFGGTLSIAKDADKAKADREAKKVAKVLESASPETIKALLAAMTATDGEK